jgi:GMP synthase-like glutamine amidotransferase
MDSCNPSIQIAILDLYDGQPNRGLNCILTIIENYARQQNTSIHTTIFDVRGAASLPDLAFDAYISTGGPGSPLTSMDSEWEKAYFNWLVELKQWNERSTQKKPVLLICHSFQLVVRQWNLAKVTKRKSASFGTFPVHWTEHAAHEPLFNGLEDPLWGVDSRDFQIVQPNHVALNEMGATILCIEKDRPHVPLERAIMGIRLADWLVGFQFHPEADPPGMQTYLEMPDRKQIVIDTYGEEKWHFMMKTLNDPEKIWATYKHIIPNFLGQIL